MVFSFILQFFINGIIAGSIYALVATGFSTIYTTTKVINFAHGSVVVLAAYVAYLFFAIAKLPFFLACTISMVFMACLGLGASKALERLKQKKTSNIMLLLASISILLIIQNLVLLVFGPKTKSFNIFTVFESVEIFGATITPLEISIITVSALLLFAVYFFIKKSKEGLRIRAVSDNPQMSESLGVSSGRTKSIALVGASILAGVAGILVGLEYRLDPFMGTGLVIKGFAGAIIGGTTSITGSIMGAFLVGLTENIGIAFLPSQFKDAITFSLLFVFLLIKPKGLFGGEE